MPQPKDKDWLNGYKNKTPIYVVYKRHTSKQGTHTELKVKGWKKIFHANREQKKAGVEKRQRRTLHNDQRINLRRYNNYKYIRTQTNIGAPQYIRQMLASMKGEINNNTIVGDFNTHSHLWVDQLNRKLTRKHKF